ncbi:hypothetical protein C7447_10931 [Tenacibaculum adriaticum]|uniref:Lipoprotein n=1 Tax=Tenacibaculum adriaticum TaxID=413713 RepID=A0A5S5DKG1_9FLAO|nr:hypothetical protein [Tenacibaculum adriaticum]TYP96094.1 hypothetical protein C7447_10931 [Tenacibaculum adriaticum]
MKKLILLLIVLFNLLVSCNLKKENKSTPHETFQKDNNQMQDFGQVILDGKIYPSIDNRTIDFINQSLPNNKDSLNFYFEVFRVILTRYNEKVPEIIFDRPNGELQDVTGKKLIHFINSKPDYFLEKYSDITSEEKRIVTQLIINELYFIQKNDLTNNIDSFINQIDKKIKFNSGEKTKNLNEIKVSLSKHAGKTKLSCGTLELKRILEERNNRK